MIEQIGTTKGTGGDILILEEAAYCDEGFFYETVAPILSIGNASLVAISTLTSEINFYTRLIKMVDPATDRPLFVTRCIELACDKCKEDGKAHECVHMLHLVPSWQSAERHRKLKIMMQDRPDLIQSELAGLAFDSLQQVFRKCDVAIMFDSPCMPFVQDQMIWIVIDPAAGGPQSDYAVVSMCRSKGCVTVSLFFIFLFFVLRDDISLPALVNEHGGGNGVVDAKLGDDAMLEVQQEAFKFSVVGRHFHVPHSCLEAGVHVEEEEEKGQEGVVWGVAGHLLQFFEFLRGVVVEILALDVEEALLCEGL